MSRNAFTPMPIVGERVELARYTVTGGERILYGQRIDGVVRVTDRPLGLTTFLVMGRWCSSSRRGTYLG